MVTYLLAYRKTKKTLLFNAQLVLCLNNVSTYAIFIYILC